MAIDHVESAEPAADETEQTIAEAPASTEPTTPELEPVEPSESESASPEALTQSSDEGSAPLESDAETEVVPQPDGASVLDDHVAAAPSDDISDIEPISEHPEMPAAIDSVEPDLKSDDGAVSMIDEGGMPELIAGRGDTETSAVDAPEIDAPKIDAPEFDATADGTDPPSVDIEGDEPAQVAEPAAAAESAPSSKPASSRRPRLPDIDFSDVADHRLIREVFAAPHRVYLLNKVRKAITSAGDGESDLAIQLKTVEADILYQVAERRTAKEALCERAEAIKDSNSWKATGDAYKALFDEWKLVGAAGRELDDELWARFNAARGTFNERRAKHFEDREQVWAANREKKEALCAQAEELAESSEWKATADKIRDLQGQWKNAGSAGRERDDALWARFNTAKQRFFDRRGETWGENRKRKEAMVLDAEALKDSTDWRTAGEAMKVMQAEWKTVGPAGREAEDELWGRFRAATQSFFDRRSSTFAERNQSERDNLTKKQELIARAEALVYSGDSLSASREAKDLQAQWKEIGPVPREQSEAIWTRFRGACDRIFENAHGERDRQQNEWHVRMREALIRKREQLNSLRESITHDEANILRWRDSLSSLTPGGKSDEIGKGLEDKIIDVMERIRDKQARAEDLRSSITDIEAKLRE